MTTTRRTGSKTFGIVAAVSVGMVLSSCSGGSGAGAKQGSNFAKGSALVIADEAQPSSGLDPIMAQAFDAKRMVSQFYEGLLELGPDGRTVQPALATKWKKVTPKRYEFTLRNGASFHNGDPVTAQDVVFSLKRIMDPKQNSPYRALYRIRSVTAPDAHHVVVDLSGPQASLLRLLAQPWSGGIVDKKWVTSKTTDQLKTQENGTGPYALTKYQEGALIKTAAFEKYWGGAAKIKAVTYRVMPDEATRVQALQSGAIQMTEVRLARNRDQLKKAGLNIGDTYNTGAYWLAMNTTKGPLSDIRVRRAINLGVDRDQLIKIGAQGAGEASGVVPPGDPLGSKVGKDMPYYKHDPAEAKKLLAQTGKKNITLTMAIRADSPEKLATAQLVAEQLGKIGVKVKIQQVEWSHLVDAILSGHWGADMVQLSAALNADPSQYVSLWFAKGAPATKINDPKLWAMMDTAVDDATTDKERTQDYAKINRYVADKAYMLIPYASTTAWEVWARGLTFKTEVSNTRLFLKDAAGK